ncbi:TPM domain-containing protein [Haloferula sp.]|uniref:TPM domain-containing protein n=1 Tax=Haloferula sp. TaxID=2497595 RepID=UPI003C77C861
MRDFLTEEQEQRVVREIHNAETRTTGEIRIVISSKRVFRPEKYAWKAFRRMGMSKTEARNGALIVVMVRHRRFFVLGDQGLNAVVEPDYWENLALAMSEELKNGERCEALIHGVKTLTDTMAHHWPADGENPNELPDEIAYD